MRRIRVDLDNVEHSAKGRWRNPGAKARAAEIDLLRVRAEILTGKDRALMKMYLEQGGTFRQMARLTGASEATIARQIRRLIKKLLDGEYIRFLRERNQFSSLERAIARDYFLEGLSQERISIKHNTTIYRVRKTVKKVQDIVSISRSNRQTR